MMAFLLVKCGQVNNYARPVAGFDGKAAAEGVDAFAHTVQSHAFVFSRRDACAIVAYIKGNRFTALLQPQMNALGVGMTGDIVQQFLNQPIEREQHGIILGRLAQAIVKLAMDAAFGKGEFGYQVLERLMQAYFFRHRWAKLAQKPARNAVHT
jgi:hypothetical protein